MVVNMFLFLWNWTFDEYSWVGNIQFEKTKLLIRWVFTRVNIVQPAMPWNKSPKIKRKYEPKGKMTQKENKGQKQIYLTLVSPI